MMTTQPAQWTILEDAHDVLRKAVAGLQESDMNLPTPCSDWSIAKVLHHAALDQRAFAGTITGLAMPDEDPFQPSGELGVSASDYLQPALAASSDAFSTVAPGAKSVPVPLPPFALPPSVAVGAAALDAAVHGWDVAIASGQTSTLSDELASSLLEIARQIVEPLRGFAYAPAIECVAGSDAVTELLCFLGRDSRWVRSDAS
jgi:uncharacterized protein (TIGR03086 family)